MKTLTYLMSKCRENEKEKLSQVPRERHQKRKRRPEQKRNYLQFEPWTRTSCPSSRLFLSHSSLSYGMGPRSKPRQRRPSSRSTRMEKNIENASTQYSVHLQD